ncbi:fatty-acid desaturase [Bradyrhizobium diazoefficiens]|uniref:hypothetical protein n=1 Tax=Bradyrhizobium diazoefficiens TaxID=1355477 RepID=UPI003515783F
MDLSFKPKHYLPVLYTGLAALVLGALLVLTGVVWWPWLFLTWGVYCFLAITNSAGHHRLFCHGSYETSTFWEVFLILTGTLSCYSSSLQYCVTHSWHHKYADTDGDPHHFESFWDVFRESYRMENAPLSSRKAMARLLKRPGHAFFHRYFWAFPALLVVILAAIGWKVLLFGYVAPVGVILFSAAMFNFLSHDDGGPNNKTIALFVSGEGRHKLHHENPHLWDLRQKWWHIDPSAWLISLIKR